MRSCTFLVTLLALSAPAVAGEVPLLSPEFEVENVRARSSFYCQDPDYVGVYNVSSGFGSEIADDIPNEFAGDTVTEVTLWVGEWSAPWQDPTGVTVNFYGAQCPPAMDPMLSFMIPWDQWTTQLVYSGIAVVYRAEATLPEPVELEAGMSIGGQVIITWGHDEPFAGVCSTAEWEISGCGEAYLDASWWGYARWSPTSLYTQIPRDFAYCLGGGTSVEDGDAALDGLQLRSRPNPSRCTRHHQLHAGATRARQTGGVRCRRSGDRCARGRAQTGRRPRGALGPQLLGRQDGGSGCLLRPPGHDR